MTEKTLESSIAERLDSLSVLRPTDRDAFKNHLTTLGRARIDDDHAVLARAVRRAAEEFDLMRDEDYRKVYQKLVRGYRARRPHLRLAASR